MLSGIGSFTCWSAVASLVLALEGFRVEELPGELFAAGFFAVVFLAAGFCGAVFFAVVFVLVEGASSVVPPAEVFAADVIVPERFVPALFDAALLPVLFAEVLFAAALFAAVPVPALVVVVRFVPPLVRGARVLAFAVSSAPSAASVSPLLRRPFAVVFAVPRPRRSAAALAMSLARSRLLERR